MARLGLSYQEKSNRLQMLCPFHQDKNPSSGFYLDTSKFFCFSCELSLDIVGFYAKLRETTRNIAARDLGVDPDPVLKYDKAIVDLVRIRAERQLTKSMSLPRKLHSAFGERLDKILHMYTDNQISSDDLDLFMIRWYKDVEEALATGTGKLEADVLRTAGNRSNDGIEEGVRIIPGPGLEEVGFGMADTQAPGPDSILDILD